MHPRLIEIPFIHLTISQIMGLIIFILGIALLATGKPNAPITESPSQTHVI